MARFDTYLFKNLVIATIFITFVLTSVVFLTQSLKFLELVVESGASSLTFWYLTSLALPRFFEIIVPLAMMSSVVFVFNKMNMDSELVAIRSIGFSPFQIGRPAILLALILTFLLYAVAMFATPVALNSMKKMQQVIQAQFSTVLFREGVFNRAGKGLTVYVREKNADGEMAGLLIHDNRDENPYPSTVVAKRGVILNTDDSFQVVVYEGSRQEYNRDKGVLQRLNFDRYIIDLPESAPVNQRWREPEERTLIELFNPDMTVERDVESIRDFQIEINKRLTSPLLTIVYTLIALAVLLIGPVDRRGQGKRILLVIVVVLSIQGLYLTSFNIAHNTNLGFVLMYLLIIAPSVIASFAISGASEAMRRQILYKEGEVIR
ncbi:MAG: LPS export ABC transporter permease LptF [Micavibrio sp.]|nr:LPS export ABC transporter permease LptF [Micavibrio sp.]|tara:strand:- start:4536 stop:5666 length:1131 start_codon:yes stop_codon:yes gene_type:complete